MEQLTRIESMAYEVNEAGDVLIEQDTSGNVDRVYLHPIHVRLLAAEMGLLKGDEDAWRQVETLQRRMVLLMERCVHLENWLWQHSDTTHADLSYEQTYAEATADLAREFCADFPQVGTAPEVPGVQAVETQQKPKGNPSETRGAPGQAALRLEGTQ